MVEMKEYIDRAAALREWPPCDEPADAYQYIKNFPASDVRSVVFCRDCEHWDTDWAPNYAKENEHFCPIVTLTTRNDWFCADGEKRQEAQDA